MCVASGTVVRNPRFYDEAARACRERDLGPARFAFEQVGQPIGLSTGVAEVLVGKASKDTVGSGRVKRPDP